MWQLDNLLSPLIKSQEGVARTNKKDLILAEKVTSQKLDIIKNHDSSVNPDLIRPEVNDSWLRSYRYGLDVFDYNYGPILETSDLEEILDKNSILTKAAEPYLKQLEKSLSSSGCMVLLSDEQGVMLSIIIGKHSAFKQINKKFQLVPGVIWTEETVGTCAHGITLIKGIPMQICGPEHYSETYNKISCSAAPIFDADGNLTGSLCIVSPYLNKQNSHSLGLVVSTALAIQKEFQFILSNELFNLTMDTADEALITINNSSLITRANVNARKMLDCQNDQIIGRTIEDILGDQPLLRSVLEAGKPVIDTEIEIKGLNNKIQLRSANLLQYDNGKKFGWVISLKKAEKSRKLGRTASGMKMRFAFDNIVGKSSQLSRAIEIARKFAALDGNVLLQGESGTGKEMFAQAIHNQHNSDQPFLALNCAAIPSNLIESELFGYEGGAFTGAEKQGRPGKFELANGGTLFLDEIGDMPLELQPVLLRVLEEKQVMRVGGRQYIDVNFRLITATNQDLQELVDKKLFREDLYYRLETFQIYIPPLRDRGEDVIELANHFVKHIAEKQGIACPNLSDAVIYRLLNYRWPGNVRQLENAMLYAVNLDTDGVIKTEDLPLTISKEDANPDPVFEPDDKGIENNTADLKEIEKMTIIKALIDTKNITKAAKKLGLSRSTLYRKAKEYDLLDEIKKKEN